MKIEIVNLLESNKIKLTNERKVIIEVLENSLLPLAPVDIYLRTTKVLPKTNLTTVYRNLELLEGLGLVKRLGFNRNSYYYELISDRGHHHHAVCRSCGKVEDLENISEKFIKEIVNSTKFKVEDHNLEFFGLCQTCSKELSL
jgi:Fur family ferric uptake transcriptional regulator